jgi:hypothetical protein
MQRNLGVLGDPDDPQSERQIMTRTTVAPPNRNAALIASDRAAVPS